jgi:hypothetical protein
LPLVLTACATLVRIAVGPWERKTVRQWLILVPSLGMVAFWFVTAPVSRYLGATCWCLAAGAVLLALANVDRRSAAVAVTLLALLLGADSLRLARWTQLTTFASIPSNPGNSVTLDSGLMVYQVPGGVGSQMWDAPLLTTPSLRRALRPRGPSVCDGYTEPVPK